MTSGRLPVVAGVIPLGDAPDVFRHPLSGHPEVPGQDRLGPTLATQQALAAAAGR